MFWKFIIICVSCRIARLVCCATCTCKFSRIWTECINESCLLYSGLQGEPIRGADPRAAVRRRRLRNRTAGRARRRLCRQFLHRHRLRRPENAPRAAPFPRALPGRHRRTDRLLPAGVPRRRRAPGRSRCDRRRARPRGPRRACAPSARNARAHRRRRAARARRAVRADARGRLPRTHARLRQNRGRLRPLLRLLHHPAGARPRALQAARGTARRA